MSLWWLEPGWKDARCGNCGMNIWQSGGDPDHGLCYPCKDADILRQLEAEREYREHHEEEERKYYAQMAADDEYRSWSA